MSLYKNKYRNESARLPGYDYSTPGYYFVTICTQDRIDRFGKIENGKMAINDAGEMVQLVWFGLPEQFPSITLDAFQIMPNHIHAIIIINDPLVGTPLVGVRNGPDNTMVDHYESIGVRVRMETRTGTKPVPTLGTIIGAFKSIITHQYCNGVKTGLVPPFYKRLLQPRFHDHLIRNENELFRIRQYIKNNPANWQNDRMNSGDGNA